MRRGAVPRGGTTTKSQQGHIPQGAGWQTEGPAWINSTTLFLSAVPLQARTHTHIHRYVYTQTWYISLHSVIVTCPAFTVSVESHDTKEALCWIILPLDRTPTKTLQMVC